MRIFRILTPALGAASLISWAVETKTWSQASQSDYEKAEVKRLSIRSDGRITLAPVFEEVFDSSAPYLWALAEDSKGALYAGGGASSGSKTRLFRMDPAGSGRVHAELEGAGIQAIAIDRQDRVYAATSPDGQVWRIAANGSVEPFYDPKTRYIWALAFDSSGNLYVATGDGGEIHRVSPSGAGTVFARTEEIHVRSMGIDRSGDLVVGTEPGGLIIRIKPSGESFVLHQAAKREVTAVAIAPDGTIYAAAVGTKQPSTLPATPSQPPAPTPAAAPPGAQPPTARVTTQQPPPSLGPAATQLTGGSELWRIAADGHPRKVWSDSQDVVYALAFDAETRLLIGTGNRGRIYRLEEYPLHTLLVSAAPSQVLVFAPGSKGRMHLATGNIGKVFRLGPGLAEDGWLESQVMDAGAFSYWGRLTYYGSPEGGEVRFESRSGNLDRPQRHWSPWAPIPLNDNGGRITSPPARFLQYRLTLKASPQGRSPRVDSLDVAYQAKNVAPVIEQIEATPANYRFPPQTLTITPSQSITLPPLGRRRPAPSTPASSDSGSTSMQNAKGWVGVRWAASDENGDSLIAKLEIRGVNEREWKLLKDKIRDKGYSWDSTTFPDGEYQVRLTVSDSPGNPPASALSAASESDPFLIDNTPPEILDLKFTSQGKDKVVTWRAKDALSVLEKAEYSVDGGEWLVAAPVTGLSDAQELEYSLRLPHLTGSEHTVAVCVTDEFDNTAVAKIVIR